MRPSIFLQGSWKIFGISFFDVVKQVFMKRLKDKKEFGFGASVIALCSAFLLLCGVCFGQDGNAGIQEATNKVKSYFDTGCDLMYAIGAVVGIIGAVKVLCAMN